MTEKQEKRKTISVTDEIWDEFKKRSEKNNKSKNDFLNFLLHIEFYFGEEFERFLEIMQVYYNDSPSIQLAEIKMETYARGQFSYWLRQKERAIVPYLTRKENEP